MSVPLRVVTFGYNADCIRPCAAMSKSCGPCPLRTILTALKKAEKSADPFSASCLACQKSIRWNSSRKEKKAKRSGCRFPFFIKGGTTLGSMTACVKQSQSADGAED